MVLLTKRDRDLCSPSTTLATGLQHSGLHYTVTMPSTSPELGDALRPDGTLKDASDIVLYFAPDDADPLALTGASGDTTGEPSHTPRSPEAGPCRTSRLRRPSRRILEALDVVPTNNKPPNARLWLMTQAPMGLVDMSHARM